jgi:hypothetical protein
MQDSDIIQYCKSNILNHLRLRLSVYDEFAHPKEGSQTMRAVVLPILEN